MVLACDGSPTPSPAPLIPACRPVHITGEKLTRGPACLQHLRRDEQPRGRQSAQSPLRCRRDGLAPPPQHRLSSNMMGLITSNFGIIDDFGGGGLRPLHLAHPRPLQHGASTDQSRIRILRRIRESSSNFRNAQQVNFRNAQQVATACGTHATRHVDAGWSGGPQR